MSAQDTTPGHLLSTKAFAFLMLSNPSTRKSLLPNASFSANSLLPGLVAIKIDPSQPFNKKGEKKKKSIMYQVDGSSGRGYYIVLLAKCACMQIKIKKKILYFYKAVMEKEANGGWTRNGCFFELLAGY